VPRQPARAREIVEATLVASAIEPVRNDTWDDGAEVLRRPPTPGESVADEPGGTKRCGLFRHALAKKLGIGTGHRVRFTQAPANYKTLAAPPWMV
jgi:hypothetical protein